MAVGAPDLLCMGLFSQFRIRPGANAIASWPARRRACDGPGLGHPVRRPAAVEDRLHGRIEFLDTIQFVQHPPKTVETVGQVLLQLDDFTIGVGSVEMLGERFAGPREAEPGLVRVGSDTAEFSSVLFGTPTLQEGTGLPGTERWPDKLESDATKLFAQREDVISSWMQFFEVHIVANVQRSASME